MPLTLVSSPLVEPSAALDDASPPSGAPKLDDDSPPSDERALDDDSPSSDELAFDDDSPSSRVIADSLAAQMREVLSSLTPREEKVLRMRFGIGEQTAAAEEEVGQDFEVTRQRIREIEAKALRKLRARQVASEVDAPAAADLGASERDTPDRDTPDHDTPDDDAPA